jgi:hypothetical protein
VLAGVAKTRLAREVMRYWFAPLIATVLAG